MIVTTHAVARWCERVDPRATADQARHAMLACARAVDAAAAFGCPTVRLGSGARLILEGETVVTVLGPEQRFNMHQTPWTRP